MYECSTFVIMDKLKVLLQLVDILGEEKSQPVRKHIKKCESYSQMGYYAGYW